MLFSAKSSKGWIRWMPFLLLRRTPGAQMGMSPSNRLSLRVPDELSKTAILRLSPIQRMSRCAISIPCEHFFPYDSSWTSVSCILRFSMSTKIIPPYFSDNVTVPATTIMIEGHKIFNSLPAPGNIFSLRHSKCHTDYDFLFPGHSQDLFYA